MGGVDAIVFTGGIGEHDDVIRAKICHHMDWLGVRIDTDKNRSPKGEVCEAGRRSHLRTLMIARDTEEVLQKRRPEPFPSLA